MPQPISQLTAHVRRKSHPKPVAKTEAERTER